MTDYLDRPQNEFFLDNIEPNLQEKIEKPQEISILKLDFLDDILKNDITFNSNMDLIRNIQVKQKENQKNTKLYNVYDNILKTLKNNEGVKCSDLKKIGPLTYFERKIKLEKYLQKKKNRKNKIEKPICKISKKKFRNKFSIKTE